jgi:hypothetical protein
MRSTAFLWSELLAFANLLGFSLVYSSFQERALSILKPDNPVAATKAVS